MSTNSLLTPCSKVRYFHVAPWPWQCERTPYSHLRAKQGAVLSRYSIGLFNDCKLRTHTKQGAVHFFPVQFAIKNPLFIRCTHYKAMHRTLLAVHGLAPENELLTHTLQARCGTFTLLPILCLRLSSQQPQAALKLGRKATD